jgi:alkylation response protein AidB-like acyl-CoA dehydrogenase
LLAYQAAWALDHCNEGVDHAVEVTRTVTAALAYATDAARRVARHAHQVHGALGFSTEYDLHLFSTRAKAFELSYGSATLHRERLAEAIGLRAST